MGSRKRPSDETVWQKAFGRKLQCHMLMITNSIVVITSNSFFIASHAEDLHVCTSERTISAYVIFYSKIDQESESF